MNEQSTDIASVTFRTVTLPSTGRVQVCDKCGAVAFDPSQHREWHGSLVDALNLVFAATQVKARAA